MSIQALIERLPKTDLHCHLDGSLRPETILELAKEDKVDLGIRDIHELRKKLVCGEPVPTLEVFLQAFDITCAVLQTPGALERVAFELAEDVAKENVRYLEVRMAPILCRKRGLQDKEVVQAIHKGLMRAEKEFSIRTGLIICALRNLSLTDSLEAAKTAISMQDYGVVGFDLAQAERGNPAKNHAEAFQLAKKAGLGITVHAGEDYGPDSIHQAIEDCGTLRIGHGRTLYQNPELEKLTIEKGIFIECCPSSNVQINLIPSFAEHPIKGYIERGVHVTLNTDNRLLTGIRVTDEYLRAHEHLKLNLSQLKNLALNGFRAAFLHEKEKSKLIREVTAEMDRL